MSVDQDAWTCPQIGCGETVRGPLPARRKAQADHDARHREERKTAVCRDCGHPFTPRHDAAAGGPTSRHPFIPRLGPGRPRKPTADDLVIPPTPKARRRTR